MTGLAFELKRKSGRFNKGVTTGTLLVVLLLNCIATQNNRASVDAFTTANAGSLSQSSKSKVIDTSSLLFAAPPNGGDDTNNDENENNTDDDDAPVAVSRRDVFNWPFLAVGSAVVTGELLSAAISGASLSRPPAHEQRVADTVRRSLEASAMASSSSSSSVFRILEVGMGIDCRLIRRGLYNQGIAAVASAGKANALEITGLDFNVPNGDKLKDAQLLLDQVGSRAGIKATVKVQQGSVTDRLPFENGAFDAVICCLTLCSVTDPQRAVEEMQRLVRPSGGTFGYIEHVAINPDEPNRFLEWQQTNLDPLQQLVADNCHLHRYTQSTIHGVFDNGGGSGSGDASKTLFEDRFLVDKMWPVSSQACGVIQRHTTSIASS